MAEMIENMAALMHGSHEARQCEGLSFTFSVSDRRLPNARYAVGARGAVSVSRDDHRPSTFTFTGETDRFDAVLRGMDSAIVALVRRRVHLRGSMSHILSLLRMMPAVTRAYNQARETLIERYAAMYDFRF
jgi:hypothetical protein